MTSHSQNPPLRKGTDHPRSSTEMLLVAERLTPWLGAGCLLALLMLWLLVLDAASASEPQTLLGLALCTTLACGGLIAARNTRALNDRDRDQRQRPAADELPASAPPLDGAYVSGMRSWTTATVELLEHAMACSGSTAEPELESAAADTRELLDLLTATTPHELSIHDRAKIHSLCTLWETDSSRMEQMAATRDPAWHRRWAARSVADRRLRHGATSAPSQELPYRR